MALSTKQRRALSKYLSWVLRHRPDAIGLELAPGGWLDCAALRAASAQEGFAFSHAELQEVVVESDKQRFELSADQRRVRAVQGHSVEVELGYVAEAPPECTFHGTGQDVVASILAEGIVPKRRLHVHLSPDRETALVVARRRPRPTILVVRSGDMARAGFELFRAPNGVWLTKHVPQQFVSREPDPSASA
ncbi:MAG TPA: RNA 2'-phosphotransferase [Polyangiaceae bacterium]|nr:RNA 2'-phosphotransferase [Polyangiaceae bacterium]HMR75081.1 RNA 2'-phosphotransferase [Polyangiaceae bacterium]